MGHSPGYLNNIKKVSRQWLILLLLFYLLIAFVYSLVLPLGEAADEAEHFALIRFIAEAQRPPLTLKEQHSISAKGDASPLYHGLVALLTQHVDVSELPELPDPRHQLMRGIPYDRLPFKGLYHTEDEALPFRGIVLAWHLARLVSIPLGAATIIAICLIMLAIYPQRPYFVLAAAGFVAFIPRFLINSAIISDDNLVIPLIAFSIYFLVRIAQGDEKRRTFIILGGLMGLAALTKYHSLLLLPEMTIVLIILTWKNGWGWRLGLRRWGLTLLAFLVTAGWWFAFLVVQFNQIADLGWLRGLIAPLGDPIITGSPNRFLNAQLENLGYEVELGWLEWGWLLFRTFWFRYGRGHVIDNPAVNWTLGLITLLAMLGLISLALKNRKQLAAHIRNIGTWRLDMILLGLHFFMYLGVVMVRYLTLPTRETAQGRHLYPALIAIAFFFMLGLSQVSQLLKGWLPGQHFWKRFENGPALANEKFMALAMSGIFMGFAILTLSRFIIPVYYPYLPISRINPAEASIEHRFAASFAQGIEFKGYTLDSSNIRAGETLPITLYWQVEATQTQDYLVQLCLHGDSNRPVMCRLGHPADGRYPMRAWEAGYLIQDELYLPLLPCLPADDYELRLSVLPVRPDIAATTLDKEMEQKETLSLGRVSLSDGQQQVPGLELWLGNTKIQEGYVELKQIRQALTLIDYHAAPVEPDKVPQIHFLPTPSDPVVNTTWSPVTTQTVYTCPDGTMASTHNFIVDSSVRPGAYYLVIDNQAISEPLVTVSTRPRNYNIPANLTTELHASFAGEVEFLGYHLDLSPRWPGDALDIEVYWRSLNTMRHRYVGSIHLLDNSVNMHGQIDQILGNNFEYPNILWAPGEVIHEIYQLPIGKQTPPGLYTLEFGVYDNTFGDFDFLPATVTNSAEPVKQLNLGQIRIMDPDQTNPPHRPMAIVLENQIKLLGYDLASEQLEAEKPLKLALHWQALSQPDADYTVFTQLIGPDGLVWGQQDNQPQGGRYPTTTWAVADKVVDRYELTLVEGAPPGQYRLVVGMYDGSTGQRLSTTTVDGNRLPDDAILLTTLVVE